MRARSTSPLAIGLARFARNRAAVRWAIVLAALYGTAIFADFLAPYGLHHTDDRHPYHPPNVRFVDAFGRIRFLPFVQPTRARFGADHRRDYDEDGGRAYPIGLFVRGDRYRLLGLLETDIHLFGIRVPPGEPPAMVYLLGSDFRGRDILSRILHGARVSLSIGMVGVAISLAIGLLVGGIAGYFGGWADAIIQRVCEIIMILPGLYVLLAIRSSLPATQDWPPVKLFLVVVIILSFIYWAGLARVIRGLVLSIREQGYIVAARALGKGSIGIIVRHVLPATMSYAIVAATVSIPGYILMESALSMLNLGIQEPAASWGNMLADATAISHLAHHPWILAPGVFISIAVMAFNFVGDGLRDAFDPRVID
ncbi:MAG: ABC transporter permease [Planctomycetes bacterium]|nr:ABC transporter permease [Planctomycetota bacterium]